MDRYLIAYIYNSETHIKYHTMFVNKPIQFIDPSDVAEQLIGEGIKWFVKFGIRKLKEHPIQINKHQIWRNFQWFRIGLHAISLISCMYVGGFFHFWGLGIVEKQTDKIILHNFKSGFNIFKKLEPDMAEYIYDKLQEFVNKKK